MPDMLVKLYELPEVQPLLDGLRAAGIDIRRSIAPEKHLVTAWIGQHFSPYWVSEAEVAYGDHPVACWIATHEGRCIGFACHSTSAKGFFGPTGVEESYRGQGIGKALLLVCLHDLFAQGYAYGIIGDAGPTDFYSKAVGAVAIPDSKPGIYRGMLREKRSQ